MLQNSGQSHKVLFLAVCLSELTVHADVIHLDCLVCQNTYSVRATGLLQSCSLEYCSLVSVQVSSQCALKKYLFLQSPLC